MNLHVSFPKLTARVSLLLLLFALTFSLAACKTSTPTRQVIIENVQVTSAAPTTAPYVFKTSEPGKITLHGFLIILNPASMIPGPEDSIFLAPMPADTPISGVPQFEVGTVPQADVDERIGEFVFTNIEPGQYAVVVITAGGSQIPVRYQEGGSYAILSLDASQADTTVEIGDLTLP